IPLPRMIKFRFIFSFNFRRTTAAPSPTKQEPSNGTLRQGNDPGQSRRGDAPLVPRLRDERDRGARAARRARWPEAGASPGAVRNARVEQRLEPRLREVRARGG